jgi:hypothetical protein
VKPKVTLIVRRGALKRFDRLKRATSDVPADLLWDRRQRERRRSVETPAEEARKSERRQTPPFTWDVADFIVVENGVSQRKTPASRDGGA